MSTDQQIQKGQADQWPEEVCIYTDGASRGNPGKASGGLVVYNTEGACLYETGFFLGTQTNNFAEYSAVLKALTLSVQNKVQKLTLKSDSELLIKQLQGIYKVKSLNIKELFEECKKQKSKIPNVQFQHVRREYNKKADELANLILDSLID